MILPGGGVRYYPFRSTTQQGTAVLAAARDRIWAQRIKR